MELRRNPPALRETCPRGLCVVRPAAASFYGVHAPAASLERRQAPLIGGGLAATVSPQAQFQRCGQPFRRSLGLAPWPTLKRCSLCGSRSPASARRGPLRSPPRLAPRSVGDCRPASRVPSLASPCRGALRAPLRARRLGPPICRHPLRAGAGPPLRSGPVRPVARLRPCSRPSPALRGRGFLPAPLPTARLRRANPLCCIEYVLKIQPLNP